MYSSLKAPNAEQMCRLLNGIVLGKTNLNRGRDEGPTASGGLYKHPVNGLTLKFTTPAALTVTFGSDLDMRGIVTAINIAAGKTIAHLYQTGSNGEQNLALWDDTTPVVLRNDGTSNTYFGFSTTGSDPSLTQTPIVKATIIGLYFDPLTRQFITITG